MELEHFDKHFIKNTIKGPAGKSFGVVYLDTLKSTFWMKNLTKRWIHSRPIFLTSEHFSQSFFSISQGRPPTKLGASSSASSYIFLMSEEKIVSFCVKNLSYWTAIERCSNNSSILQKDLLCSNCCALSILSKQFSDFPIIMLFAAFHKPCFLENIIKDISNIFRLKKELNYTGIKDVRNVLH